MGLKVLLKAACGKTYLLYKFSTVTVNFFGFFREAEGRRESTQLGVLHCLAGEEV
jgi:hypothetical protein